MRSLILSVVLALVACETRVPIGGPSGGAPLPRDVQTLDAAGLDGASEASDGASAAPDTAVEAADAGSGVDAAPHDATEPGDAGVVVTQPDAAPAADAEGLADAAGGADAAPYDAWTPDAGPRPDAHDTGWRHAVIDQGPASSIWAIYFPEPRVAVGPDGVPQVVYELAEEGRRYVYARFVGTGWDGENIGPLPADADGTVAPRFDIAVDSHNVPHVTFTLTATSYHAQRRTRGDWALTPIGAPGLFAAAYNLAGTQVRIDATDQPVVAFGSAQFVLGRISVRRRTNAGWVDVGEVGGTEGSLAFDSGGLVHLLYSSNSGSERTLVRHSATGWDEVMCGRYCGNAVDVAFDPAGQLHYVDGAKHYTWNGTTPRATVIETEAQIQESAIAADRWGGIHIAYRTNQISAAPPKVRYAYDDGQTVHVEDVTIDGDPGWGIDLALTTDGRPVIVYFDMQAAAMVSAMKD